MNTLTNKKRQIVLDTETTGINSNGAHYAGHRIIEIGAVEMINRRFTKNNFHIYLNPERPVDIKAFHVHGISDKFLKDKPFFKEIFKKFFNYIKGAELIIHNAPFDVGFIDYEFEKLNINIPKINTFCTIIDTLVIARKMFPGKRNNLDALSLRYNINHTKRSLHGALLDAQILADVFLLMTEKQNSFFLNENKIFDKKKFQYNLNYILKKKFNVIKASRKENELHEKYLDIIQEKKGNCLWRM